MTGSNGSIAASLRTPRSPAGAPADRAAASPADAGRGPRRAGLPCGPSLLVSQKAHFLAHSPYGGRGPRRVGAARVGRVARGR